MRKYAPVLLAVLTLAAVPSYALNKDALMTHLRKAFNIDSYIPITIGDPSPSQFGEFQNVPVTFAGQQQMLLLSKDERYYIVGNVMDLNLDPDKDRMSRVDLSKDPAKGSAKAPVTIVEFSDLQCPNCQKAHEVINEKLFKDYPNNQVRIFFKHFPLSMHEWAEPAAVAAECAEQQGNNAFWKMVDRIYKAGETEIKASNIKDKVRQFAGEIKLDQKKFDACLDSPVPLERVHKEKQEGTALGINATPTFMVNGRLVRGNRYDDLKNVIDEKLKEASAKK